MNTHSSSETAQATTVAFYDDNAEDFFERTFCADMGAVYKPFLLLLPKGAHILDAGCGSGRDSRFFLSKGYQVTAMDASKEMARRAEERIGLPVLNLFFHQIDFEERFEGIWACASLLHVSRHAIDDVFERLTRALKPGGIFYASFKYGDGEMIREGRLFNHYQRESFGELLDKHDNLNLVSLKKNRDQRPDRPKDFWLNALLKKEQG